MNRTGLAAVLASMATALTITSLPALAQQAPGAPFPDDADVRQRARDEAIRQRETVTTRPRPEYDALGVRYEGFYFYPKWTQTEEFDDNIFAEPTAGEADLISIFSPAFQVRSDWNNHA